MINSLIRKIFPCPQQEPITRMVVKKDPNGFVKRDVALLRKYCAVGDYEVGDSIESVAYRQGQEDVLRFIERKLIAKHKPIQ